MVRQHSSGSRRPAQAGFSLVELLIAIVVLLVGVVAVAKLVPTAIQSNLRSRYDSTGVVLAERQLELMARQPIDVGNPVPSGHYSFLGTLPDGVTPFTYRVGLRPPAGGAMISAAGAALIPGSYQIDWNQPAGSAALAGYRNTFTLNEGTAGGARYETRWAVVTYFANFNGTIRPVSKRIIVSVRGGPAGTVQRPATVGTLVSWRF
ncbi:MAG TPA: prepilin-type N-terminal cleavage/methylation domain-containing protein [Candidatus Xenobia bacterium]|nr:prepilin-type N-terminal cleavage/methylation domain-containing protein [Candidatus Xenobia bacterium]